MTTMGVRTFRRGDEPGIIAVIDAGLSVDRLPGITRQDLLHGVERMAGDPEGTLVATENGAIVGFCTPRMDELTIHPAHRRRGHGRRLVTEWLTRRRAAGEPDLVLHGPDRPAAAGFIAALGFVRRSSLWLFELAPDAAVPAPAFPADVRVRTYRDGDLARFVEVANASFADHPSPVLFTERGVGHVHGLSDFDPDAILLVFASDDPDRAIGWAKAEYELVDGTAERRGFVSFVGIVPAWRGRGLGRALLRWAIERCRAAGARTIELSVEAANDRALGLYRSTGFTAEVEWPHYALATGA
ncbi:MAG TPA: GNAT family N-acetyltransferase [Candidatus Limnocylindrales bacterium]|nr:GNAT family N-acetyltransferase [Candidatus Limnocylindrales bacterium]